MALNTTTSTSLPTCDLSTTSDDKFNSTIIEEKRTCAYTGVVPDRKSNIAVSSTVNLETDIDKGSQVGSYLFEELESSNNINISNITTSQQNINITDTVIIKPKKNAPTKEEVLKNLSKYGFAHQKPKLPFYSNLQDIGSSLKVGRTLLKVNNSENTNYLLEFETQTEGLNKFRRKILDDLPIEIREKKSILNNLILSYCNADMCIVQPAKDPPTPQQVKKSLSKANKVQETVKKTLDLQKTKLHVPLSLADDIEMSLSLSLSNSPLDQKIEPNLRSSSSYDSCLISGVSINDTYNFNKPTEDLKEVRAFIEHQYITVMVMELLITTRGDLKPDPSQDPIQAIFYSIFNDVPEGDSKSKPIKYKGIIVLRSENMQSLNSIGVACDILYVDKEEDLLKEFINIVHYWDPDIVAGYEIEMLSWGYLLERGVSLKINLNHKLGRSCLEEPKRRGGDDQGKELKLVGRIVLDVWRVMRHEIALQSYTFESIVYHILHKRVPHYAFKTLTSWWDHYSNLYRHRIVKYYLLRVDTVLELFDKLDFINRTSELAR